MTNQTQEQEFKSHFKAWNADQKRLRPLLGDPARHEEAIDLFLRHHAVLHAGRMAQTETWSFEDSVLDDMTEDQIRRIPAKEEHSIAWLLLMPATRHNMVHLNEAFRIKKKLVK